MNHSIKEDEFCDLIHKATDIEDGTYGSELLKELDEAGYVIVRKMPAKYRRAEGNTMYSPLASDVDDSVNLEGKVVANYSKHITISHGLINFTLSFTDGTRLAINSMPTRSDVGSKLDVVFVEPFNPA